MFIRSFETDNDVTGPYNYNGNFSQNKHVSRRYVAPIKPKQVVSISKIPCPKETILFKGSCKNVTIKDKKINYRKF